MNRVKNIQGYADDLVLFAPTAAGLKVLIEPIENLILDHELMNNVAKTEVVIFKPVGRVLGANISFECKGEPVETVDEYKYLGVNIQSNLMEKSYTNRVAVSFNRSV